MAVAARVLPVPGGPDSRIRSVVRPARWASARARRTAGRPATSAAKLTRDGISSRVPPLVSRIAAALRSEICSAVTGRALAAGQPDLVQVQVEQAAGSPAGLRRG